MVLHEILNVLLFLSSIQITYVGVSAVNEFNNVLATLNLDDISVRLQYFQLLVYFDRINAYVCSRFHDKVDTCSLKNEHSLFAVSGK